MKNLSLFMLTLMTLLTLSNCDESVNPKYQSDGIAGVWEEGSIISISGNVVTIDMSSAERPNATGKLIADYTLNVYFPDDATYSGTFKSDCDEIEWSHGTSWYKVPSISDFNGSWGGGSVITISGDDVTIDMSSAQRPNATGTVTGTNSIEVNFPDDATYSATIDTKCKITWSNGGSWTR